MSSLPAAMIDLFSVSGPIYIMITTPSTIDYYKLLDISKNATDDEIKTAYKKMVLKWHPDRHMTDKETASQRFIEIHNAYKALTRRRGRHYAQQSKSAPTYHDTSYSRTGTDFYSASVPHVSEQRSPDDSSPSLSSHFNSSTPCTTNLGPTPHANEYSTQSSSSCRRSSSAESCHPSDPSVSTATPPSSPKSDKTFATQRRYLQKPTSAKLRKQSKPRHNHKGAGQNILNTDSEEFVFIPSFGKDESDEEVIKFHIQFTLEELFHGAHHRYRLKRYLRSGKRKGLVFEVDIPPGCRPGSKVIFRGVGNERKNGTLQDVVFVIEETPHEHLRRVRDDLFMDIKLPWATSLQDDVVLEGLDGQQLKMTIDYRTDKALNGRHVFRGAGMPVRRNGEILGTGDLIVIWEIVPPSNCSKWESLKKVLHIKT